MRKVYRIRRSLFGDPAVMPAIDTALIYYSDAAIDIGTMVGALSGEKDSKK